MKLQDFGLLSDENLNPAVIAYLRQQGFDVLDVKEDSLVGKTDEELIRLAVSQNRVIMTHDRDFGRLAVAMLEPIVGIVYLRPGHVNHLFTIASLEALFDQELNLDPAFIIVVERSETDVAIRVRHY